MGEIRRMGQRNSFRWGNSPRERARARTIFDGYVSDGFDMFRLTEDGERGSRITEFDPNVHGIVAVPRMGGG